MSFMHRMRQLAGAIVYDWPRFERLLRRERWLEIRNRAEQISVDGRGVRCEWRFTSDLHIARVFPSAGARLMRRAFETWPLTLREHPEPTRALCPEVAFVIGHRGMSRLPHLSATLRSIAGQRDVAVECVVVEQSERPECRSAVPSWVRYLHVPVGAGVPYNRASAFNDGVKVATARVLIFHDNDMPVPASYAAEARARLAEGWQFADLKRFIFYLSSSSLSNESTLASVVPEAVVQNARGGSVIADRGSFEQIGGFDDSFLGWGGEDNEFWERAESTGRANTFGYMPLLHLHHQVQPGKRSEESGGVARYRALESIPPAERISDLLARRRF